MIITHQDERKEKNFKNSDRMTRGTVKRAGTEDRTV
jgi:hypothetical protein